MTIILGSETTPLSEPFAIRGERHALPKLDRCDHAGDGARFVGRKRVRSVAISGLVGSVAKTGRGRLSVGPEQAPGTGAASAADGGVSGDLRGEPRRPS